jgi:hypothetical protein
MARLGAVPSVLAILIGSCTGADVADSTRPFASDEVPWSFPIPSGWHASTNRSEPDPNLRVGSLSTNVSTVPYSFDFDQTAPGPNSGQGASEILGPSAAVLRVLFHFYPADDPIGWNHAESATTVAKRPTAWHDDAQNPGWAFRERRVCLEDLCVWVVEWHGPEASEDAIVWMERIAQSLQLAPRWIDPPA